MRCSEAWRPCSNGSVSKPSPTASPGRRSATPATSRLPADEGGRTAIELFLIPARDQLRGLGFADSTVDDAVARGHLHPVFHAVFSVGHRAITVHARLRAAAMACGPGAVVSHGTAAWLWGFQADRPEEIDAIAPVESGRKIAGVRRRFVALPTGREVGMRSGVRTTSAARTIVDNAGILSAPGLAALIEQAAVRRALDVGAIDAILAGPRRRNAKLLLRKLEPWRRYEPGIVIRSRMEAKLLPLLSARGLPIPETNGLVVVDGKRFEIDFLWRHKKVAVETDGGTYHDNPLAGFRDSNRNRALIPAGYVVARLGWEELRDRPEQTIAEIARLLALRPELFLLPDRPG